MEYLLSSGGCLTGRPQRAARHLAGCDLKGASPSRRELSLSGVKSRGALGAVLSSLLSRAQRCRTRTAAIFTCRTQRPGCANGSHMASRPLGRPQAAGCARGVPLAPPPAPFTPHPLSSCSDELEGVLAALGQLELRHLRARRRRRRRRGLVGRAPLLVVAVIGVRVEGRDGVRVRAKA